MTKSNCGGLLWWLLAELLMAVVNVLPLTFPHFVLLLITFQLM